MLNPIKIFGRSFGGPTLYENEHYISPNEARRSLKTKVAQKFRDRQQQTAETAQRKDDVEYASDEVDDVFRNANAALEADSD